MSGTVPENGEYVVLGGTGFIGSLVAARLAERGSVTVMGRRPPRQVAPGVTFHALDLQATHAAGLREVISGASVLVNATGSIWGKRSDDLRDAVIGPTETTIGALSMLDTPPRYVHMGSMLELYPASGEYAVAKAKASQLVCTAASELGLDCAVLRIANAIGPGVPASSLLGRAATQLLARGPLDEPRLLDLGSLDAERDFVDVRDVADAVVAACEVPGPPPLVPIGSGQSVPVGRVITTLLDVSGVPASIAASTRSAGHSSVSLPGVDLRPAWKHLRWTPRRSLVSSVEDYWDQRRMCGA